jgi:hypothetical protein
MSEKETDTTIPEKFYKAGSTEYPVVVRTVGELIEALKELPKDLEINQEYSDLGGAEVVVYNILSDRHLCLRENEEF